MLFRIAVYAAFAACLVACANRHVRAPGLPGPQLAPSIAVTVMETSDRQRMFGRVLLNASVFVLDEHGRVATQTMTDQYGRASLPFRADQRGGLLIAEREGYYLTGYRVVGPGQYRLLMPPIPAGWQ